MITIFTSNDPIEISFVKSLLTSADIPLHIADVHTSIIEGSIGILPRRVMVLAAQSEKAIEILSENGLIVD